MDRVRRRSGNIGRRCTGSGEGDVCPCRFWRLMWRMFGPRQQWRDASRLRELLASGEGQGDEADEIMRRLWHYYGGDT